MLRLLSETMLSRRNARVFFSVCMLCLPTVHVARVFPNDLFSRLQKHRSDPVPFEQIADDTFASPKSFSSPPLSPEPSLKGEEEEEQRSIEAALPPSPYHHHYTLQTYWPGPGDMSGHFHHGGNPTPTSAVSQAVVLATKEAHKSTPYFANPAQEPASSVLRAKDERTPSPSKHPVTHLDLDPKEILSDVESNNRGIIQYHDYYSYKSKGAISVGPRRQGQSIEKTMKPLTQKQNRHDQDHSSFSVQYSREPSKQNACPYCQFREEARNYRIESLKQTILRKLSMVIMPNRTGLHVPRALAHMADLGFDLLQSQSLNSEVLYEPTTDDDDEDEYPSPPSRLIVPAQVLPRFLQYREEANITFFTLPEEVIRSQVTKANLWFYVSHSTNNSDDVIEMRVDLLIPTSAAREDGPSSSASKVCVWKRSTQSGETGTGWHKVDLTPVIQRWAKNSSFNHGLKIAAFSNGQVNMAVHSPSTSGDDTKGYEPTLDIITAQHKDPPKRRNRRSLVCTEQLRESRCCRYPLHLTFREYGWDWVIAPSKVEVGYCSGECRMTLQYKTPHSWLLAQAQEGGRGGRGRKGRGQKGSSMGNSFRSSCCVPSKMMAIPLLYFNHEGVIVHQLLRDIRVEHCRCA